MVAHKAKFCLLVRSGRDSILSIYIHSIYGKQVCEELNFFKDKNLFKPMWSCLRFKWQFSESQMVLSALSLTMIIVIEQNIVFSTEVYEFRHLRFCFQSRMYRPSHVSLLNTECCARYKEVLSLIGLKMYPHNVNTSILQHYQLTHFSMTSFQLISF